VQASLEWGWSNSGVRLLFDGERWTHPDLGPLSALSSPLQEAGGVFSHSLNTQITPVNQQLVSPEFGLLSGFGTEGWMLSSVFGWTHFGQDENQYGGWVSSERFGWMKFEASGQNTYLWAPMINSWMAVNADGSFYSFQWGLLTPQGLTRYESSVFGKLTTGDFGGWVSSERFGWMWANGDQVWFWSETLKEWLGVTAEGGIWSTKEEGFL
jgi:hypothetical protein